MHTFHPSFLIITRAFYVLSLLVSTFYSEMKEQLGYYRLCAHNSKALRRIQRNFVACFLVLLSHL